MDGMNCMRRACTCVQKEVEGSFLFRLAELTVLPWKGNAVNRVCFRNPGEKRSPLWVHTLEDPV